jgi:hypothetical protein
MRDLALSEKGVSPETHTVNPWTIPSTRLEVDGELQLAHASSAKILRMANLL